jgi:hypothetical protein
LSQKVIEDSTAEHARCAAHQNHGFSLKMFAPPVNRRESVFD